MTQTKLDKITELKVNDSYCCKKVPLNKEKTHLSSLKSALEYHGPKVKSLKLGDCPKNIVGFGFPEVYIEIVDDCDPENVISILTQTCTNISELQIGERHIEFAEKLIKANKSLKRLILTINKSTIFPGCAFDTTEELFLLLSEENKVQHLDSLVLHIFYTYYFELVSDLLSFSFQLFPNLRLLALEVDARAEQVDSVISSIVQRVKHVKLLEIVFHVAFESKLHLKNVIGN